MRLRVLFSGIDGTGKTSTLDGALARLEGRARILRIGSEGLFLAAGGERRRLIDPRWEERVERIGEGSRRLHLYGVFLLVNFAYKYARSRYFQATAEADLVFFASDTLLHPAVYLKFHFPAVARWLGPGPRFRLTSAIFGGRRHTVVFYLAADPAVCMERIAQREREEGTALEPHENLDDLRALEREFQEVLAVAERRGYEIHRIDTTARTREQVVAEVESRLAERLPAQAPAAGSEPLRLR